MIPFLCAVALVSDGDTLRCTDGTRVRIAGIDARERDQSCHGLQCPLLSHDQARAVLSSLTYRQTLTCEPVGTSYKRVVAVCRLNDGRDLGCAMVANGGAVEWPVYRARYRLRGCR